MYPTLREIVELPVVRAGRPRVRAGSSHLDVQVRWVHVSELRDPVGTLSGGELVLSTGMALAEPRTDPVRYVAALVEAGAVGLMIELGEHLTALPDGLVQAARADGLPVVELARHVRFVEITEVVHAQILGGQLATLQRTQQTHEVFRALAVDGAPTQRILDEAAGLAELPVVLEDLAHRALAFGGDLPASTVLRDWSARSRRVPASARTSLGIGPEGWNVTPVGARDDRWGRLVVPHRVGDDRVVAVVLEQAAHALTVTRLLGRVSTSSEREAQDLLVLDLAQGGASEEGSLRARAQALNLPTRGHFVPLVVATRPDAAVDLRRAVSEVAGSLNAASIVGVIAPGRLAVILACSRLDEALPLATRVAQKLPSSLVRLAGVGAAAEVFTGLREGLEEASFVVDVVATLPDPRTHDLWTSADLGIEGLMWKLRDDARLQDFVDEQLEALTKLPGRTRDKLIDTLFAYLEAGGAMTVAANALQISRPAAYGRLTRLREVLAVDLENPRVRLSLHVALLAFRRSSATRVEQRGEQLGTGRLPAT